MNQRRRRRNTESASEVSKQIEERDREKESEEEILAGPDPRNITEDRLIPSGVTLVNCACSDNHKGAFALGSINTIPGKSASGKSIFMLTMLACCAVDKRFKDYDFIYDDGEQSLHFDLDYLFPPLALRDPEDLTSGRLQAPTYDEGEPIPSETIQDFKANVLIKCKQQKPFIWVLDSLDSLTSTEEMEKEYKNAIKMAKSAEAVVELKGSYKMEKAKHIGETLRMINGYLKHSDSALFIVQQTRTNIGGGFGSPDWTTSGGHAPFFYSFHQVYVHALKQIPGEAMNLKHKIGSFVQFDVVKNKLTGKKRKDGIVASIYEDYGIDDVSSCVDFLKRTGRWKSAGSAGIEAEDFGIKMPREKLIRHIEEQGLYEDLQEIVGEVWQEAEDALRLGRRRRF